MLLTVVEYLVLTMGQGVFMYLYMCINVMHVGCALIRIPYKRRENS